MIVFDRTGRSVVAICTACGARDVFTAQAPADRWAIEHLNRAHPAATLERARALTATRVRKHRDR